MTMVDAGLAPFPAFPMLLPQAGEGGGDTFTFDAASDALSLVFKVPKTGTIDKIHYRIVGRTSPVMTRRIEMRTVNAATGIPNAAGTLYGSSTSITVAASGDTANTNMTAAVNATATAGDVASVVFDLSAFTSGSFTQMVHGGIALAAYAPAQSARSMAFPYSVSNTAAADVLSPLPMMAIALEYSGGIFVPITPGIGWVGATATDTTINSGANQRVGNAFTPLTKRRVKGFYAMADIDGAATLTLRLASDNSILASAVIDKDLRGSISPSPQYFDFDGAAVTLTAGTAYHVLLEGTDATGGILYGLGSGVSQAMLDTMPGGQNCFGVTWNGSAYTNKTTANAVRRYSIGLISDQEDDGTGGSGVVIAGSTLMRGLAGA